MSLRFYRNIKACSLQPNENIQFQNKPFIISGKSKSMEDVRKPQTAYVPRQQQFNHMLDTAYDEILVKKAKSRRGQSTSSGNNLYESFRYSLAFV